jgi:hypothetical protein
MIDNADANNRFQAKAGRILPAFFVLNDTPTPKSHRTAKFSCLPFKYHTYSTMLPLVKTEAK